MNDTLTIVVWCEAVTRGCTFSALLVAGVDRTRYGGSGATAWEAIAWCLDEYLARTRHGYGHEPARRYTDAPGDRFSRPPG